MQNKIIDSKLKIEIEITSSDSFHQSVFSKIKKQYSNFALILKSICRVYRLLTHIIY